MSYAHAETTRSPQVREAMVSQAEFSASFDRCFRRVHAYVSKRVSERELCERIVRQVLAENLDLLVERGSERHELTQLKAASDRLIRSESAKSLSTGTGSR